MSVAQKDKFQRYVEEAQDLIYEVNTAGEIVYMSPAIEKILGYSPEKVRDTDFKSYILPEYRQEVAAKLLEILYTGETREIEVYLYHADGNVRIHLARGTLLIDEEGKPQSVMIVSRDVTERRKIEIELKKSEERYRSYVENAPQGVFVADETGQYQEVNPAACRITGYAEEELLSMQIDQLVHPDGREHNRQAFDELKKNGYAKLDEPFIHKSGEKRWWTVTAVRLSGERLLGFTEDITEKKQAHDELHRTHGQLLTVLNGLEAGVFVTSQNDNTILYTNRFVEELFGEDLTKKKCEDFFNVDGVHRCEECPTYTKEELEKNENDDKSQTIEYPIAGMDKWFLMHIRGIEWIDGSIARLHILSDISAIKEREKLKEDIARITQHDLKTPLNGILGSARLLLEDTRLDPTTLDLADMIEQGAKRMLSIINRSLSLYKIEAGTYTVQNERVSCTELLETVVDDLSKSSIGKTNEFHIRPFECPAGACSDIVIEGEYNLCYSILTNILKNAAEASNKGERIPVYLRKTDSIVEISVWNSGAIPPEIRNNFGEKYFTSQKHSGTGLGVYSARMMTDVQNGRFLWSSSEEEGTTVTVVLPSAR